MRIGFPASPRGLDPIWPRPSPWRPDWSGQIPSRRHQTPNPLPVSHGTARSAGGWRLGSPRTVLLHVRLLLVLLLALPHRRATPPPPAFCRATPHPVTDVTQPRRPPPRRVAPPAAASAAHRSASLAACWNRPPRGWAAAPPRRLLLPLIRRLRRPVPPDALPPPPSSWPTRQRHREAGVAWGVWPKHERDEPRAGAQQPLALVSRGKYRHPHQPLA